MDQDTQESLQDLARKLWEREGGPCVSELVLTLAKAIGLAPKDCRDLDDLAEQALMLCAPVEDYESAALEAGWKVDPESGGLCKNDSDDSDSNLARDWREACEMDGIEPYESEVFEHWVVSGWLGALLESKGEKVAQDFAGLTIWARTTTGQAIYCDHVMQKIAVELQGSRL